MTLLKDEPSAQIPWQNTILGFAELLTLETLQTANLVQENWIVNSKIQAMSALTMATRRKLTPKGHATRARIVAAAAQRIQAHGATRTSTEEICEAAGVSSSQLYHYFADKGSLVRAVIAYQTERVLGVQREYLGHLDSIHALRKWRDLLVGIEQGLQCEGGCPLGTLAAQLAETSHAARVDLCSAFERWEDGIRSGLRTMYDRGEFPKSVDPDRLALALLAAVEGGFLLTQVRRTTAPLEDALDTVLDYIESLLCHPEVRALRLASLAQDKLREP
jgi:AcrR family transcriptional regulator